MEGAWCSADVMIKTFICLEAPVGPELLDHLPAVHDGHEEIEQDDAWLDGLHELERSLAVGAVSTV